MPMNLRNRRAGKPAIVVPTRWLVASLGVLQIASDWREGPSRDRRPVRELLECGEDVTSKKAAEDLGEGTAARLLAELDFGPLGRELVPGPIPLPVDLVLVHRHPQLC